MILIKNVEVYSPEYKGKKDVFVSGGKISLIEDNINFENEKIKIIDGSGKKLTPGFIDQHVHITGGGGEGSFKTRAPEITLSKLTTAGITTVVGLLGTDGTTRSVENLVSKAKALKEEGITVFAHTGSYEYPSVTVTGSIKKDICFIDEIIGVKLALSDHRAPNVSNLELQRVASDARVAGMLSGKPGIVVLHMGDGKKGLQPVREILEETEIPMKSIRPTHVNRREELLKEAFDYAKSGGKIDLTCGIKEQFTPGRCIKRALEENVPSENITISSDGYGSWSKYDEAGNLVKMGVSSVSSLHNEFKQMVNELDFTVEDALVYLTSNVAKGLEVYPRKGCVAEGSDADLLLLDENLDIDTVIANGKVMIENKEILVYGSYEQM
ncbi:isoaspartyl dipeptidase [Terrisporobacter othiniensis]|uniref:Isoaspartyl dipeptidase n=1 Tax=Terrisporobacter othiniensis TaxID=1577792 RepID=A0A0B3WQC7_9FIRM|nr:beta-aspartyl-peptidase [Terrisporobacter othiniensis]KHS56700.1 isoaspartyl dipeptidase [Terrisporobacter othiniensis]